MNKEEIIDRLQSIASSDAFITRAYEMMKELSHAPDGSDAVEPILLFMERNPDLEYGTPGPLVHFVERFWGHGYDQKLCESIGRRPTWHTVWMLNRLINGAKQPEERQSLIQIMKTAEAHPLADADTRDVASHCLTRLG
jgi:hypothetical protein